MEDQTNDEEIVDPTEDPENEVQNEGIRNDVENQGQDAEVTEEGNGENNSDQAVQDNQGVESRLNDPDAIVHRDELGESPTSNGDATGTAPNRVDYMELAQNQFNLTPEEAEELFSQTQGESFDEEIVQGIKDARTTNVLKSVEVDAGLSNPKNLEDAQRDTGATQAELLVEAQAAGDVNTSDETKEGSL